MTIEQQMQQALDHFSGELHKIRTGRANPALVTELLVESYGTTVPLKQVAQVATPDATSLLITPWDPQLREEIEKAIKQSDLGIQPTTDGNAVRLSIPPMTEDRRRELTKAVGEKLEAARVALRNIRHEALAAAEKEDLSQDDLKHRKDELTKQIQEFSEKLDQLADQKRQELMTL